ncbi:hypothetical protein B0H16DRAFT_1724729 [Mycena metata]|uniref:Uncharacterized protein n=1 Tax=Mycena metata TaxID=1033252 RepID=A0AAD7N8M1_9AGAR|nr:hypothetical protein B0H16DRAFT_1724729 [Mycena metata]
MRTSTIIVLTPILIARLSALLPHSGNTEVRLVKEMGKTGYINWTISQLLVKAKEDGGDELHPDDAVNGD